jgi:flagellar basal body-associated protein FliL
MAEEEKTNDGEEIVVKKSGNSQIMIMFVLCIAVIVLTPFAVLYALKIFDGTKAAEVADKNIKEYAQVIMPDISVNIAESKAQHVALVELTLHVTTDPKMIGLFGDGKDGSPSLQKVFHAEVIDILRVQTLRDLEGEAANKKKLEEKIKVRLNQIKTELANDIPGQILRVYFSKYMLQ